MIGLEQLQELIAAQLDPDEILDVLEWTTYDLVEVLSEYIKDKREEFEAAVDA